MQGHDCQPQQGLASRQQLPEQVCTYISQPFTAICILESKLNYSRMPFDCNMSSVSPAEDLDWEK